jgi:hypothetical protein
MSYSALTEIGTDPICPACTKPIVDGEDIVVALVTKASLVPGYSEENGADPRTVYADMDWTDQIAFHLTCLQQSATHFLELSK